METQALQALREILNSTSFLLKHYQRHVDSIDLSDVQDAIGQTLAHIDGAIREQAAD